MSLYIGKDNSGKSILHVSSLSKTISELKSGVYSDTIFHNSINYVTAEVYDLTNVTNYSNSYHYGVVGLLSSAAISDISSRFSGEFIPIYFVCVDGKIMHNHCNNHNMKSFIWDFMDTNIFPNSAYTGHSSTIPTSLYKYKALGGLSGASISIILTSLSYSKISGTIINSNNLFNLNNSISISATDIMVRGTSLKNTKFVTLKNVNSIKSFVGNSSGDSFSVLNSSSSTSVTLNANNTRIYMKNSNDELIFDTNIGKLSQLTVGNISYSVLSSTSDSVTWSTPITITNGDSVVLCGYNITSASSLWSSFYIATTVYTTLYAIIASSSGTTYEFSVAIKLISGVYKLVFKRTLIRIGSDGNPGKVSTPDFSKYFLLK